MKSQKDISIVRQNLVKRVLNLDKNGLSANGIAAHLNVPESVVHEILNVRKNVKIQADEYAKDDLEF